MTLERLRFRRSRGGSGAVACRESSRGWALLFELTGSVGIADDWGDDLDDLLGRRATTAEDLDVLAWLDEVPGSRTPPATRFSGEGRLVA